MKDKRHNNNGELIELSDNDEAPGETEISEREAVLCDIKQRWRR
jgi:hypothetical protein